MSKNLYKIIKKKNKNKKKNYYRYLLNKIKNNIL